MVRRTQLFDYVFSTYSMGLQTFVSEGHIT